MSRQIKVIKCPQCGSTQNKEIKPDFFKCGNCGTEYYLDNDDINVNYNYNPQAQFRPTIERMKRGRVYLAFVFMAITAFIFFIGWLALIKPKGDYMEYERRANSIPDFPRKDTFRLLNAQTIPFFRPGNTGGPVLCTIGIRDYSYPAGDMSKDGVYLSFYDILEKKDLGAKLIAPAGNSAGINIITAPNVTVGVFANGDIYFILDRKRIYRVNRSAPDAEDVTASLFATQPKLKVGIASVEFVAESAGNGFHLMTNEGATFSYYPLADRVYTQQGLEDAEEGTRTLIRGGKDSVYYAFTSQSLDFPEEKLQLLKIHYKDNNGGPVDIRSWFSWQKDYGHSGFFTDADPYKKTLIDNRTKDALRITGFTDLTPGRLYFKPSVLYGDRQHLLILVRATAAPEAPLNLQSLDPNTGALQWTAPAGEYKPQEALPFRSGYIIVDRNAARAIDSTGKLISEYKIK